MTELTPVQLRQAEVNQYQTNIELYTSIAAGLPSEWPERLVHLKGEKNQHEAIAQIEDLADVALLGQLWAYEAAKASIRSEMVEKAKAEAILNALIG